MDSETALQTARLLVEFMAEKVESPAPNRLDIYLKDSADLIPIVAGLRVKRLGYLAAITGLDMGVEDGNLEVLYHFCVGPVIINIRLQVPKISANVPSLCEIIPNAEAFERELSEMFGVTVTGLRNPERLYLPDDWNEDLYPMRKDFNPQDIPLVLGEI